MLRSALALLLALVFVFAPTPALAAALVLDDPAQAGDNFIFDSALRTGLAQSVRFSSGGNDCLFLTLNVTTCTACSLTMVVIAYDPGTGQEFNFYVASAAVVATGVTRHMICPAATIGGGAQITQALVSKVPPWFKVWVNFSGTSATYSVSGWTW